MGGELSQESVGLVMAGQVDSLDLREGLVCVGVSRFEYYEFGNIG